jgi:hypothetical protein
MMFQLRELAIPVVGDSLQGAWSELGSTCRKGGSTCVAREPAGPQIARGVELELVRRQIRETVLTESAT